MNSTGIYSLHEIKYRSKIRLLFDFCQKRVLNYNTTIDWKQAKMHKDNSTSASLFGWNFKVTRERDNLGKQLLRRNEERVLLYEKVKIQQSIISKRDFHHNQRMEDIRLLKLEIKRIRREKNILDKAVPNADDLK